MRPSSPGEDARFSKMRSETDDFEARIAEKVDNIEEGLDDVVVKFDRSIAEFEKFKK